MLVTGPIPLPVNFFSLFNKKMSKHCKNSSISLVHRMLGWTIPQDNRMMHQMCFDK